MAGVNKVIIVGNLGKDPEVRFMPNGGAVANLTVATSETWKDKQTGEQKEKTEWHNIVMYQRLAEIAGEYLKKGSKVYLEGSLQTSKWTDKQTGQDRYKTEIKAKNLGGSGVQKHKVLIAKGNVVQSKTQVTKTSTTVTKETMEDTVIIKKITIIKTEIKAEKDPKKKKALEDKSLSRFI